MDFKQKELETKNLVLELNKFKTILKNTVLMLDRSNATNFYAYTFLAAAYNLEGRDKSEIMELIEKFLLQQKTKNTNHAEFNIYALQQVSNLISTDVWKKIFPFVKYKGIFFRKVSNWVLLRNLNRIRSKKMFLQFKGLIEIYIILLINRHKGYITDNTLRMFYKRKESISSQYHAFAILLIGELYEETKNKFFLKIFFEGLKNIDIELKDNGFIEQKGRGKKQIFGYASVIYIYICAYKFTGDISYIQKPLLVVKYLETFTGNEDLYPIVLDLKNPDEYLYSYNNTFDYIAFLYFFLNKSYVRLTEENN